MNKFFVIGYVASESDDGKDNPFPMGLLGIAIRKASGGVTIRDKAYLVKAEAEQAAARESASNGEIWFVAEVVETVTAKVPSEIVPVVEQAAEEATP
jgi:hypothetical protein